ncbi:MAG: hypothetical protein ACREAX_02340 [Candidatus Nitrosotenuis sp.]
MANVVGLVFSNFRYAALAAAIFVGMLFLLSSLSEYVFFEPYFVFHVPSDRMVGFALIVGVSVLSALAVPMSVYLVMTLQKARRASGGFLGSLIGASAGACSCGPVGFTVISTFGTAGGIATAFLTMYEIPLRLASLGILGYVLYTTSRSLSDRCNLPSS